mmetsp:Transcript_19297/g.42046  ORF Transcript_19297/g.42046 Transcript_19297/m.42046 type:complete len:317 (+) Transcript_19297:1369-2319(+)
MPRAILSRWKSSTFTPLSPAGTSTLRISSAAVGLREKLYWPLANDVSSLRLSAPSLSRSYFEKIFLLASTFFRASHFFVAFSVAWLTVRIKSSVDRVTSLIRFSRSCRVGPDSDSAGVAPSGVVPAAAAAAGGAPGRGGTFMSAPFWSMKSLQALALFLASAPASSAALAVAVTSSIPRFSPSVVRGSASSLKLFDASSADSTSFESSARSSFAFASLSSRFFSASALRSSSFLFTSSSCCTRKVACCMFASHSSCTLSLTLPQLFSSRARTSASSFFTSSKVSMLTVLAFCRTRRMASAARCSSRFWASSASRFF